MTRLDGKVILVTGATSGIGRNTAYYLTQHENARIIVLSRSTERLESIQADLGDKCLMSIPYDLEELEGVGNVFEKIRTGTDGMLLDGLVHCAGVSPLMSVANNDIAIMREAYAINVFAFIELAKHFQDQRYSSKGSSVVVMSSIAAQYASNRQTVYSGSKAAIEASVRCMAKEFLDRKIRVNAISAGAVETEMLIRLEAQSATLKEKLEEIYPYGTIAPDRISQLIAYLLSDDAANISGSTLRMDSGFAIAK